MKINFEGCTVIINETKDVNKPVLRYRSGDAWVQLDAPPGTDMKLLRDFMARHRVWIKNRLTQTSAVRKAGCVKNGVLRWRDYTVEVTCRANARRMVMRYRATEDLFTLTVPPGCTEAMLRTALEGNEAWMQKQRTGRRQADWQPQYAAGERHMVLGQLVALGQNGVPCGEAAFRQYRAQQLKELLEKELDRWQRMMNVRVNRVTVRSMRSKWGSCRPQTGSLSFAEELGCYPPECVTETVVHELTHMLHPDHSAAFYADMTRFYPEWKKADELRKCFDVYPRRPER